VSDAAHAMLRARVAQHLAGQRPRVDKGYGEAGTLAIEAMKAGNEDAVITLPTGEAKRAHEVIGLLALDGFLME
jgi:hypothetical protein